MKEIINGRLEHQSEEKFASPSSHNSLHDITGQSVALPPAIKVTGHSHPSSSSHVGAAVVEEESSGVAPGRRLLLLEELLADLASNHTAGKGALVVAKNATSSSPGGGHSSKGDAGVSAEEAAETSAARGLAKLLDDGNSSSASYNSSVEAGAVGVGEALQAAGASWTVVLLLAVSSLLLGTLWLLLLGEFTTSVMYVNLCLVPFALLATGIYLWVVAKQWHYGLGVIVVCVVATIMLWMVRDRLKVTFALLAIASKALSANYSLVAIAVGLSCVQIVWLGTSFLFIGLSFMSGQAIVVPTVAFEDNAAGARCMWETDGWAYIGMLFIVIVMLWTNAVLSEVKRFVISGGIALWYFHPSQGVSPKSEGEEEEVTRGWGSNSLIVLNWALSASFGSLCVSSLTTLPCEIIRAVFQPRRKEHIMWGEGTFEANDEEEEQTKGVSGTVERVKDWWDGVCREYWDRFGLEDIVGFVDRMAVPMMSFTGYPFFHSAKSVSYLLGNHNLADIVADKTSWWVMRGASAVLALCSAVLAALFYTEYVRWALPTEAQSRGIKAPAEQVSHLVVWVVFWGSLTASSLILQFFAGALLDAMDVLFLLYAVDRQHKRVGRRGRRLHDMLAGMHIGRAVASKRYTPRGWTYVGSGVNTSRESVDTSMNTARRLDDSAIETDSPQLTDRRTNNSPEPQQ